VRWKTKYADFLSGSLLGLAAADAAAFFIAQPLAANLAAAAARRRAKA
jgi:hypothetical protein